NALASGSASRLSVRFVTVDRRPGESGALGAGPARTNASAKPASTAADTGGAKSPDASKVRVPSIKVDDRRRTLTPGAATARSDETSTSRGESNRRI
ncbi:MAG: hypothetical protein RLZZ153_1643, partial [Pseudomonadota bacterium]